jgi:hypothetical protein
MAEDIVRAFLSYARGTPRRTFVLYPAFILGLKLLTGGGSQFAWRYVPMLAWGYLQYRLCRGYRGQLGGGGPGVDREPVNLVTTGPYALTRNPMYLGHIIFLVGLALFSRSGLAWVLAAGTALWFDKRVREDEERLALRFGRQYEEYRSEVARWIPGLL